MKPSDQHSSPLAAAAVHNRAQSEYASKKIAMGFDGFVDQIVRIVKDKKTGKPATHFERIREWGDYILAKSDGNFAFELDLITTKLGGNMPIMAHALASLGYRPLCVGALGYPEIDSVFRAMKPECQLFSYANPGITTALEFNKNKILLGEMKSLHEIRWENIIDRIGRETVANIFSETHLVALVNWSEIEHATEIWEGVFNVMTRSSVPAQKPLIFFDLADCSRKSREDIREVIQVMASFRQAGLVALSLNHNETNLIFNAISSGHNSPDSLADKGEKIAEHLRPDYLILRQAGKTFLFHGGETVRMEYAPLKNAVITTGAGDHFNAGFCAAWLMGQDAENLLPMAHAVAACYMNKGSSPGREEVNSFLTRTKGYDAAGI